jgi:hypothetical protein
MNNQIQSNYLEVSIVYVNSSILDEETLVQTPPFPQVEGQFVPIEL